ncbi:hypothetical protein [uncultured Roseobacter sp.]|uniref:hypothetical protein n=1 Tax=uncultured Roseobacter sp. TaxID=114847 RepID=UPI0026018AF3|nr:hypothetical protein [uncultured Roseobacter sp.]
MPIWKRKTRFSELKKAEDAFELQPKDILGDVDTLQDGQKVELAKALMTLEDNKDGRRHMHKNLIVIGVTAVAFAAIGLFMLMVTGDNGAAATEIDLLGLFTVSTQAIGVALLAVAAAVAIFGIRSVTKE